MRILFMGGKKIGCACLEHLIKSGNKPVGIVINPSDMVSNRWYPSACEIALKHKIPVFQWGDINSQDAVTEIRALKPDIILTIYFYQLLIPL